MAVYFIQSETGGPIKIGRVRHTNDVAKRLKALQTGNPSKLRVIALISRSARHEAGVHAKFSHLRQNGEWFEAAPELLDFINQVNTPDIEAGQITPEDTNLIKWLERELQSRHWMPSDLSRVANLGNSTVQRVLAGTRVPGQSFCIAIAKALKVSPDKVFRLAGLLPPSPEANDTVNDLMEVVSQLPEADQREVLNYARYRLSNQ